VLLSYGPLLALDGALLLLPQLGVALQPCFAVVCAVAVVVVFLVGVAASEDGEPAPFVAAVAFFACAFSGADHLCPIVPGQPGHPASPLLW